MMIDKLKSRPKPGGFFCYGFLAAAVVTTTIAAVVSAAAEKQNNQDQNPSAAVTAKNAVTHIANLLSCLQPILCRIRKKRSLSF